mmetsp:Transcript_6541/g.18864  ORF Transcript_6541/g.18864 Transcript_6541/m.18864 type:complete len:425 (-) Transcript_6541:108-1382(-)|eukprot:CAMPEP_0206139106 /NCGR_PEP_ID=MMETSP1473-20131121/4844_1 /ASSEMBLY_ACC=CAM_ASM_001109 /TAXON_ID=1461547 /ORGANISM="Stichococcus sp, Strain RCC1054" /LENGTH=424 /DNA_ID=CAMNT_0053532751 /DNA_START=219 /DNA_END=1493 /DNA_ORIENTATION=-
MARKKIREYDSKRLLKQYIMSLAGLKLPLQAAQVDQTTDFQQLLDKEPWLNTTKLVVKPDMLFGKRGKNDLLALNVDYAQAETFITERMNKQVSVDGCSGGVSTFIVEPFVPHDVEYYLCIQSQRLGDAISFSDAGGIEIEENWDRVKTVTIPTAGEADGDALAPLLGSLPLELRPAIERFIQAAFMVFRELDFSLMEMNPFTLDKEGLPFPLDMRGELDDTAAFKSGKKWGELMFPQPFGRTMSQAEQTVHEADEKTGASLKLTILNPKGRVWTMVAGGGASVIYTDTVGDLGYAQELGNYAEYSGAPSTAETYTFAKTLLRCCTANPDGRKRALLVGGGIANFTSVAATFTGIVRAMKELADEIKAANVKVFVRRGGPQWQAGLDLMRKLGQETGIEVDVHGPSESMTCICKLAIDYVRSDD